MKELKTLLIIWLIALAAVIGTYAYIFTSIDQKIMSYEAERTVRVMKKIETVNPQLTVEGKSLQGGGL